LIHDNKLPNFELSINDAVMIAIAPLTYRVERLSYLADLIKGKKLPYFLSGKDSSTSKRIARDLLSQGPPGPSMVKA
jgi:hypothetical protein